MVMVGRWMYRSGLGLRRSWTCTKACWSVAGIRSGSLMAVELAWTQDWPWRRRKGEEPVLRVRPRAGNSMPAVGVARCARGLASVEVVQARLVPAPVGWEPGRAQSE